MWEKCISSLVRGAGLREELCKLQRTVSSLSGSTAPACSPSPAGEQFGGLPGQGFLSQFLAQHTGAAVRHVTNHHAVSCTGKENTGVTCCLLRYLCNGSDCGICYGWFPYIKGIWTQHSWGSIGLLEGGFECLQLLQALQGVWEEKNGCG